MSATISTPAKRKFRDPVAIRAEWENQVPLLVRALRWLDGISPAAVCAASVLLIIGIFYLSHIQGPHLSSSLFYLVPVLLVTRVIGFRAGILASLVATLLWLYRDLNVKGAFLNPLAPYWNCVMRMGTWTIIVGLVSAMRSLTEHLEERVIERTSELEAKIAEKLELEESILEISDREQARIGQDLHDGLCQQLVSAAFSANMLQETVQKNYTPAVRDAGRIADMIDDAITQARNLARGLYPVRLETEGLEMALRELAPTVNRRFELRCAVNCPKPLPPCKPSVAIHLYRIVQEAVINAGKHAKAKQITISLVAANGRVSVTVEDDGVGLAREGANPTGMGMNIMEYRARMIDADFAIGNRPNGGTRISCELGDKTFQS